MNNITSDSSVITETIYREYKDRVYQYIQSRITNVEDAKDLLSSIFLKVHEHVDSFDSKKASISTWLYTITRNTVNDYLRRKYRAKTSEPFDDTIGDYENDDLPILDRMIKQEQLEKLSAALEQLPEREKDIIIMRFYYEQTSLQIADRMKLSHENVRYLQHVAIGKLRKIMD